jgi:hypothetical protein
LRIGIRDGFSFNYQNVNQKYNGASIPEINCPEEYLGYQRKLLLFKILNEYIASHPLPDLILRKNITNFFKLFQDVYTINYDLITYWVILKASEKKQEDGSYLIVDGFDNKPISSERIHERLTHFSSSRKLLFLHGAYHLYHWPIQNLFQKIITPQNTNLPRTGAYKKQGLIQYVESCFNQYAGNWTKQEPEQVPIIVMESTWYYKKAVIMMNDYLKLAFKYFSNIKGEVFVYGCSFAKDDYILEALLMNKQLDTVYISVRQQSAQRQVDIEKKIAYFKEAIMQRDAGHSFPNIIWVAISPAEQHLIWEFDTPLQDNINAA